MPGPSYYQVISEAVADLIRHGYDSVDRIAYWADRIRAAAVEHLVSERQLQETLARTLGGVYAKKVDRGGLLKTHPTVARFTLDRVRPQLRAELDRRIHASADLIRLNREQSIEKTLQRFRGWGTSIPAGGTKAAEKRSEVQTIRKPLVQLPFEERRVLIDQGHKFTAELSAILARDANALAGVWHSHWRERGYNFREDHKERDERAYAVRGNWAMDQGLMKAGPDSYTDAITRPAEEPFCRCSYRWIFTLRDLPPDMLTEKGRKALTEARVMLRAVA